MLKKLIPMAAIIAALAGCTTMGSADPMAPQAVGSASEKLRIAMIDPTTAALEALVEMT